MQRVAAMIRDGEMGLKEREEREERGEKGE